MRCGVTILLVAILLGVGTAEAVAQTPLYDFYRDELTRTADSPTVSRSLWSGRFAPAAWRANDRMGLYVDWIQDQRLGVAEDFSTVLSLKYLGFSARHLSAAGQAATDYTLGLSLGNKMASFGLGYAWQNGSGLVMSGSDRLQMSAIWRTHWTSLSWANAYDVDRFENVDHYALGVRPFGPRLTLYGDYLGYRDSAGIFQYDGYDESVWGYGANAEVWPGVSVGVRADDEGAIGLRLGVAFDGIRPSAATRNDKDGNYLATTWSVEFARGPALQDALPGLETYPQIDLKGPMTYRRYGWFDDRPRFLAVLAQINHYSEDPAVDGVIVNMSGMDASPAMLWELRSQLAGLRERGKTVAIYFDRVSPMGYAFATVADEVWIDPQGEIDLRGINLGRSYYKETLAKIGVGFDEWRFFKYKSAAESFSRTSFSEGAREQLTEVMNEFWDTASALICDARGLTEEELMKIVDEKVSVMASEAEDLRLVDAVGDFHDLVQNAPMIELHARRGGQTARLGPLLGDRVYRQEEWSELPQIAVLYAIGPCAMDSGIHGRQLSRMIRHVRQDPRVKAVVLRADSPGGDPLPSDLVARELRETSKLKPVIVSQGQVAGSGGYWISMFGDQILASPMTITGSIGVISAHVYDDGLSEKLGIDYDHVQIGRSADAMSGPGLPGGILSIPHRPVTEEERARAEEVIMELYDGFVNAVATGRDMEPEAVREIAQGRIYTGVGGVRHGLVDQIGGLWDALVIAKEAAGLSPSASIGLLEGPDLGPFPADWLQPKIVAARMTGGVDPLYGDGATVAADAEASVSLGERPEFFAQLFSVEQWSAMSTIERAWVRQVFLTPGRPITMMEPFDFGWTPR